MDLSVIIPARDAQSFIAACLRSVTRCPRDHIEMECIVVSDGSQDGTPAIVKRYIERDSRIRLITGKGSGPVDARDLGIEQAKGRYLMFLDARDRLCEDAWEHIEAAVEEEYADFVAFSHILLDRDGKLRARMLPIADVVSTDVQEAKRLMYADCALDACWGKLFRSDIVKTGHITFRTDLVAGADLLFVAEYFGNCESYLLTKAMITCHRLEGDSLARKASIEERLDALRTCHKAKADVVARYDDPQLTACMQLHHLNVLIGLFREYGREYRHERKRLEDIYQRALEDSIVKKILSDADGPAIRSARKSYAHRLLKSGNVKKIRRHLRLI